MVVVSANSKKMSQFQMTDFIYDYCTVLYSTSCIPSYGAHKLSFSEGKNEVCERMQQPTDRTKLKVVKNKLIKNTRFERSGINV